MQGQEDKVREELVSLIKISCDFGQHPTQDYQEFHKSFLKFSFSALEVQINYDTKLISVWNSKPFTGDAMELYNSRDSFLLEVNYTNLEETLLGCVEEGVFECRFYRHLICEYSANPSMAKADKKAS